MALPWTFGLELEFAVAFVHPHDAELPDETETRKLRFNVDTGNIGEASSEHNSSVISVEEAPSGCYSSSSASSKNEERAKYDRQAISNLVTPAVQRDIAETFLERGFPACSAHQTERDFQHWTVDTDGSINPPYHTQYIWAPIEVISPAMEFNPENLEVVEKICNLITSTYVTHTGPSTGVHVHVSAGIEKTFRLETLQNLFAFLYAFEPQISTLHPVDRQKNVAFCDSIRRLSTFVSEWWEKNGQLPTVMQGVVEFLKNETMFDLLTAVRWPFNDKATRYNASNLFWFLQKVGQESNNFNPPTIEFRQHEGTLAPPRVINWIRTLVGIINFVDTADPESLRYLLQKAGDEKWQKEGTPDDAEQQEKFGPIPAEGNFTVIDLFQYMQLDELADFYSNAIHEVVGVPPIRRPRLWEWEYEQKHARRRITDEEFQRQHEMRMLWEQSLTSALAQPEGLTFNFNPYDEMWPVHANIERSPTNRPGFTLHANAVTDLFSDGFSIEPDKPSDGSSNELTQSESEAAELAEAIEQLGMEYEEEDLYSAH